MVEQPGKTAIHNHDFYHLRKEQIEIHKGEKHQDSISLDEEKFATGIQYLNKEFYGLLKSFQIQYTLLFRNLKENTDKFDNLTIITQGYDFAIPTFDLGFGFNLFKWHKPLTNFFMKNGKWLKLPLLLKGIKDPYIQEAIVYAMIYEFNEMLIKVTSNYNNVYHVDCRGLNTRNTWYNELHPESNIFRKIARAYEMCIDGKFSHNHIIVKDL
jgi:hypothetical protein